MRDLLERYGTGLYMLNDVIIQIHIFSEKDLYGLDANLFKFSR